MAAKNSKKNRKKGKKSAEKDPVKEKMKEEIARELGLADELARKGWGGLTSRETGKIGGYMGQKIKKKKTAAPGK